MHGLQLGALYIVYQVDMTILRWLELRDNEVLELERGEDVDVITKSIGSAKGEEQSRVLEQIKYRDNNLTLNSEESLEMLLNFYLHKKTNPTKNIYFRFITNTNYGTERPCLFQADGKSGIEVWIELFNNDYISEDDSRILIIKNHILDRIANRIKEISRNPTPDIIEKTNNLNDFSIYIGYTKQNIYFSFIIA